MNQFDVCRNIGVGRSGFPYYVVIQSREFAYLRRRLVVPLANDHGSYPPMAPRFTIQDRRLVADALLMFSLPVERLGPVVTTLLDDGSQGALIGAIDRVISRG